MGTITKALNLMNYFSESAPELGLMELKNLTGQDKTTIHRHLTELEANGFLEQNSATRKYRLGAAILRLSAVREVTFPARRIVSQWVDNLSVEIGELVHAALIQNDAMSPLYFNDGGSGGTRVYFSDADMLPLHATASGLAALAFGSPDLLERTLSSQLPRFTSVTIIDKDELVKLVHKTQANGFAFSDQAYENEVSSLAVPFFEDSPYAYGTISIALPSSRIGSVDEVRFVQSLWDTSETISKELGGQIPNKLKQVWRMAA